MADFIGETNFLEGQVEEMRAGEVEVVVDGVLTLYVPTPPQSLPSGGERGGVTVAIRPEKISLHAAPPDQRAVPGVVQEVVYTGTDTRYLVQLTEKTMVTVRQQNIGIGATMVFAVGAKVYLHWQPGYARLLPM